MSTSRETLRKLLLDAIDSNEAWLVLCDAIEEDDAHEWLRARVAMLVFGEWQTHPWPCPLLQRQRHPLFAMLKKGA